MILPEQIKQIKQIKGYRFQSQLDFDRHGEIITILLSLSTSLKCCQALIFNQIIHLINCLSQHHFIKTQTAFAVVLQ